MGNLVQSRQGVRYTKPQCDNIQTTITPTVGPPSNPSWLMHIHIKRISKLYTDGTCRFPIRSCGGNQYLMIMYNSNSNAICVVPPK